MIARLAAALLAATTLGFVAGAAAQKMPSSTREVGDIPFFALPAEARETIALIRRGGPFPYAKDGVVFGNREGMLPRQKRGYYREYTVKTPHERSRGARRISWGKGGEFYYTEDHYSHFRRVHE